MIDYYDCVLALIPGSLLGITLFLSEIGLPFEAAVTVGAGAAALVVGHAVFVNAPVDEGFADAPARSGSVGGAD
jgi:hypothetical protein